MQRLTKTFIGRLIPPSLGQLIYRDDLLRGFGLRHTPNSKSFVVEGTVKGKRIRKTIGRYPAVSVFEARRLAAQILNEMKKGIHPNARKFAPTLEEVLHDFIEAVDLIADTKKAFQRLIRRELSDWLPLQITSISKEMIQRRHRDIVRRTRCGTDNRTTANKCIRALGQLINFANVHYEVQGQPLMTENFVSTAMRWRWFRANIRQGTIPDHKLPQFYTVLMKQPSKIARDFLLFTLLTGLRRTESRSLRWDNIDFDSRLIHIPGTNTKNKRDHFLPITDFLDALLRTRRSQSSGEFLFPGRDRGYINEPRAVLARMRKEMGWHWLIHDLRRTALSAGEKAGVPYLALQLMANHAIKRDSTQRYIILDADYLRPHMEAMNFRLLELMETSKEKWSDDDCLVKDYKPHFGKGSDNPSRGSEDAEEEEVYW